MLLGESQFSKGGIFKQMGLMSQQLKENAYRSADYEIALSRAIAARDYAVARQESSMFRWDRRQLNRF